MKYLSILSICSIIAVLTAGCSSSSSPTPTPSKDANVTIVSELSASMVNMIKQDLNGTNIQANEVDSIKITRIRILISELKLFQTTDDTANGRLMKTGPFVYDVDLEGTLVQLTYGSVPAAKYDKIKFEFHRFSANETDQFANDIIFKDFATKDRYSVIIEGIAYKNNTPSAFTFNAQTTSNLMLNFNPVLDLTEGSTTTLAIQVNPILFFKSGSSILDPRESKNFNNIENAIRSSIKAIKK